MAKKEQGHYRTKFNAIISIIVSEHFISITQRSAHSSTPSWGKVGWWSKAEIKFKEHKIIALKGKK